MSPSAIALTVIFVIVLLGSAVGFFAGTRQKMSLEQWTVGSRGFGTLLMWLLMAGESYTTFSVLGADAGTPRMQEIAAAVREGAQAYLRRQYLTIGIVGVVIFFVLTYFLGWLVAGDEASLVVELGEPRRVELAERDVGRRHQPAIRDPVADVAGAAEGEAAREDARAEPAYRLAVRRLTHL